MAYTPAGRTRERVYRFVRRRLLLGEPPSVRDVQGAMGFSAVESARKHLEALVGEGRLSKAPGRARGFRLPRRDGDGAPVAAVPLVGQVQAGNLTAAIESPEGYLAVQARGPAEALFALTVRGESMTGAGILPGDTVIVRRQPDAEDGDIVVALVGDEATVKRLRRRGQRAELLPENPAFDPIRPAPGDLAVLGKVIEVRRVIERA